MRQTLPKPKRSGSSFYYVLFKQKLWLKILNPLGGLPPKARNPLFASLSLSLCLSVSLSLRHISTWNCRRTDILRRTDFLTSTI